MSRWDHQNKVLPIFFNGAQQNIPVEYTVKLKTTYSNKHSTQILWKRFIFN